MKNRITPPSPPANQKKKKNQICGFSSFLWRLAITESQNVNYYCKTYKRWHFLVREFFNTDIKEFSKLEEKGSKLEETQNQAYETF